MKTAIYSLYQRRELSKARCFLSQLLPVLNAQCQLHILINDDDCPDLRAYAREASPHINIHWAGSNLGVASGRNLLIHRALEDGAEFLISCDTDIIYDTLYFDRLRDAHVRLSKVDPQVGFLQPILLDGRQVIEDIPELKVEDWDELLQRVRSGSGWRANLWRTITASRGLERALQTLYHTGVSNVWRAHFGDPPDVRMPRPWTKPGWFEIYGTEHRTLRSEPQQLAKVIDDTAPVRISSAAGGVVAFHANMIGIVGEYDDIFNPFGYEDSEMGFRSALAGRNNYLIPDAFAIHDIFMDVSNRTVMSYAKLGLLRGLELTHPALGSENFDYAIQQSILFCWRDLLKLYADEVNAGRMSILNASKQLPDFVLSYGFDLFRGLLHGLAKHPAQQKERPFLALLRGFLDGNAEITDLRLPLGFRSSLVAGRATTRKRLDNNGTPIYSLFATNCRIEELTAPGKLCSRYFDIASVVRKCGEQIYRTTVDVQSDDQSFGIDLVVELPVEGAHRQGSAKVKNWQGWQKRYEFGRFSVEDIYPAPTLHQSTAWLPMMQAFTERVANTANILTLYSILQSLMRYLKLVPEASMAVNTSAPPPQATARRKKRILVFSDSRGQHKPAGGEYLIFGERLAADNRLDVDLFLCPMKWTTTLDFLEAFDSKKLRLYDHVILYTGIVDWSPRHWSSAINDLYDNVSTSNTGNLRLNTRDYSKKVVNNKKRIFDEVFGSAEVAQYFRQPFDTLYEDEKTINMYSLEMAECSLLPRLNEIPNLTFVSANRFVEGWNGDYRRLRPANIALTHAYSDLFSESLSCAKVIDLREWSRDEVKEYTCDNIHLTQRGSDFLYDRIMAAIGMSSIQGIVPTQDNAAKTVHTNPPRIVPTVVTRSAPPTLTRTATNRFTGMRPLERITAAKKPIILTRAKREGFLATLVIGVRLKAAQDVRTRNLRFLLEWLDFYYGDLFDVLLLEQDSASRFRLAELGAKPYVRHEFVYNPSEYNRGWGYNVAIRHFCDHTDVVALMDTDVLTGTNFIREIIDCHSKYDAISPYQNIYYTDSKEAVHVQQTKHLDTLTDPRKVKNPVTVAGGILIVQRHVFLALKGFEQYMGYGCEDRAFDVTLYNHVDHSRIRIASGEAYAHLHHPSNTSARARFEEILDHLQTNYGCKYDPTLGPYDFIHQGCTHASQQATLRLMNARAESFGDRDLYRGPAGRSINGVVKRNAAATRANEVIFPPAFKSLDTYERKEIYENAPEPDSTELAVFYNAFQGKRCFIMGNGPSLNKHNLSLLNDEYTFGVNSLYYKTRETGFRPFFYVVEDSSVMKENIDEIRRFDAPFKFFPANYRNLHPKQPNTFFFRMNRGFYEKSSLNYVVPRFSTDATKVLYCGQSVTYINLQLAYFMGFSEVYLIGMDFSYVIPESHKRTGDVLLSDTDDLNHFHKDYFGKGKTWKDPKLDRVAWNYRMAKLVYEATGRRIYNATIGGSLGIFDRVDYGSLFGCDSSRNNRGPDFAHANALYRDGRYAEALSAYTELARANGAMFLYKRSALEAFLRATHAGQTCTASDAAFVRGIMFNV